MHYKSTDYFLVSSCHMAGAFIITFFNIIISNLLLGDLRNTFFFEGINIKVFREKIVFFMRVPALYECQR